MAKPLKPISIRPWQYISLSCLMFMVSALTFFNFPNKDVADAPVFTTFRDRRVRQFPQYLLDTDL